MAIYDMFIRKATPPASTSPPPGGGAPACKNCGEAYPEELIPAESRTRIGELEGQVKILTDKASAAGKYPYSVHGRPHHTSRSPGLPLPLLWAFALNICSSSRTPTVSCVFIALCDAHNLFPKNRSLL